MIDSNTLRRTRLVAVAAGIAAAVVGAQAQAQNFPPPGEGHRPMASEVMLLPRFCWAQFTEIRGPEFQISSASCGYGMNHYCFGLTEELRANKSFSDRNRRLGYLNAAKSQTLYTINAMKNYPACPLRPHVEETYRRIESTLRAARVR